MKQFLQTLKFLILLAFLQILPATHTYAQSQLCGADVATCVVPQSLSVGANITARDSLNIVGDKGSTLRFVRWSTLLTPLSGATTAATNLVPAGSVVLGCTLRVTTLVTLSAGTTFTFGDGTTADLFGTGLLLTVGTVTNGASQKSTFAPKFYQSAMSPTLTGTGGNFTAGAARISCYGYTLAGPTAPN